MRVRVSSRLFAGLMASAAAITVAGCAVGPNFERPEAPAIVNYTGEALPDATASADINGGSAQHFKVGDDVPGQWWGQFKSDAMNRLIAEALNANPDLASAQATLEQAQANADAAAGSYFPSFDARGSAARQGRAVNYSGPTFNLFNASVSVAYVLDVFGGVRRSVEATEALAETSRFRMEATYSALTSNVLTTAIRVASVQAQISATQDIIKAQSQELDLLNQQFELGAVAKGDVLAQQSQLAQTQATLPSLQKLLSQFQNQLAQLLGRYPGPDALPTLDLNELYLPTDLPVSVPSKLVDQRPDIRQAEANLHAASAGVGVATANLLPQFTISASYGDSQPGVRNTSDLFDSSNIVWNLASGLTQPIFHGGALIEKREAALAAFDAAAASYRAAVLSSFQDVANVLRALQLDAEALRVQLYAEQTASQSLDIVQERFRAGAVSYISLLDAERTYQQARIALVQAQANRYADTVALFVALGGGWWNRDDGKTSDTIMNTANSNVPTTPATPAKSDTAPAAVKPKP